MLHCDSDRMKTPAWKSDSLHTHPPPQPSHNSCILPTLLATGCKYCASDLSTMNLIVRGARMFLQDTLCSWFRPLYLPCPSSSSSKLSPLIPVIPLSTLLLFILPPFPTPSLQRSSRNSGVCHCMLAVELRTVHKYVIHRDLGETRVRRHRSVERQTMRWDEELAMPPCTPPHQHTPTSLQQQWEHCNTQMHTDR